MTCHSTNHPSVASNKKQAASVSFIDCAGRPTCTTESAVIMRRANDAARARTIQIVIISINRDALSRRCHVAGRAEWQAEVTSLTAHSRPHMHARLALALSVPSTNPPTHSSLLLSSAPGSERLETIYIFVCACPDQLKKI